MSQLEQINFLIWKEAIDKGMILKNWEFSLKVILKSHTWKTCHKCWENKFNHQIYIVDQRGGKTYTIFDLVTKAPEIKEFI